MASTQVRKMRRIMGAIANGLKRIGLKKVYDPRVQNQVCRPLSSILTTVLLALATGRLSLKDMELQSDLLSLEMKKKLKHRGRLPDTTVRSVLMKLDHESLRGLLFRQVRSAHRSKQLEPAGFPLGQCAIDGKYSVTKIPDGPHAQNMKGHYELRTMTAALVSAKAPVVMDAMPVRAGTNEMGTFAAVLKTLNREYGRSDLIELVSADAGMTSLENADLVIEKGWNYLFSLKGGQPTLLNEADRLLGPRLEQPALASTLDVTDNQTTELRELWITEDASGYHGWGHLKTVIRIRHTTLKSIGPAKLGEDRYFLSSLAADALSPAHWLRAVRNHWRVENDVHCTLDRSYKEDDRPWIYATPGQLSVTILRRVMFNMMAIYRNVSLRGERKGDVPWRTLISTLLAVVYGATQQHLKGLRWPELPVARVPSRPD